MDYIPYGKQTINNCDINAVVSVLKSDWLTTGPKILEFEKALCTYINCNHAVAVNSGTSALDIAIQVLELPEGSEVITTPFSFVATSNAILYDNLTPVFVDIDPTTFNIDPSKIEEKITDKTKAILFVDYAGYPCDIKAIGKIADKYDLYLIEDAAHSLGAEYNNIKVGNLVDLTAFSFHPIKSITTGEGGAVTTNNRSLYEKLKMLRNHGIDKNVLQNHNKISTWKYDMKYLGRNYRMTDIQAALGISQLEQLDTFIIHRNKLSSMYTLDYLFNMNLSKISKPLTHSLNNSYEIRHSHHIFPILFDNKTTRDECFTYMRKAGIGVNLHYIPIYRFSYYVDKFNIDPTLFPVTEDVYSRIMTLPLYPSMSTDEHEYVCNTLRKFLEK